MFINISTKSTHMVTVCFEGKNLKVREGLNIAVALLEAGVRHFRDTPANASARAPFCMMGACFDCLLIIDGVANQQSCMIEVRDGMQLQRQPARADVIIDNGSESM